MATPAIHAEPQPAREGVSALLHEKETFMCTSCSVGGAIDEQRAHYRSDLHRLNLKRALSKRPAISQADLDAGLSDESLSGSATSSSSSEGESEALGKSPKVLVVEGSTGRHLTVWRNAIVREDLDPRALVVRAGKLAELLPPLWAVFMCSGGHFAAVIMDREKEAIVQHKTFHRYTTRKKQGGTQSAADAQSGGHRIKSAGAALRRYGEAALAEDVRGLVAAWKPDLERCGLVFMCVSFSHRGLFFDGGEKAPFSPRDGRLRRVPFMTRRPTFEEAKRVLRCLAQAEARPREGEGQGRGGGGAAAGPAGPAAVAIRMKPRTAEEEAAAAALRLARSEESALWAAVARGDLAAIEQLAGGDADGAGAEEGGGGRAGEAAGAPAGGHGSLDEAFEDQEGMTVLHAAAAAGAADTVALLLELGASPCLTDLRGRVPYAVAKDAETRNAFRRHMGSYPDAWDWKLAKVPSPLTDEAEAERARREKEKRKAKAKRAAEARRVKKAEEEAAKRAAEEAARRQEEAARVRACSSPARGPDRAGRAPAGRAPAGRKPGRKAAAGKGKEEAEGQGPEGPGPGWGALLLVALAAGAAALLALRPAGPARDATPCRLRRPPPPSRPPGCARPPPARALVPPAPLRVRHAQEALPEREKRARAAEARLRGLGGGAAGPGPGAEGKKCAWCGAGYGTPFERLEYKYCSTKCVGEHRAQLDRK
eukprot:tig00021127_g18741.t1